MLQWPDPPPPLPEALEMATNKPNDSLGQK